MGRTSCCTPTASGGDAQSARAGLADRAPFDRQGTGHVDATIDWCRIPAGRFTMGTDGDEAVAGDGEGPARAVALDSFTIAAGTVTNAQFATFVRATGYITDAERVGSSYVFALQLDDELRTATRASAVVGLPWWRRVDHACWQRPEGPGSAIRTRPDLPVVHVSWNDAQAWCAWAGTRLPSEAQWERAARGGLDGCRFAWGDDLPDEQGAPRCNIFRGDFPDRPIPGWWPGPVDSRSGQPNGFGLFNSCGNVWEWCSDRLDGLQRALRGGSFLCHDSYCNRYRVSARSANSDESSASNIGFRVIQPDH